MIHDEKLIQEHVFMLGGMDANIRAIKEGQTVHHQLLTSIDNRLRTVEMRAARNGLIAGGVMGIGTAIIIEKFKNSLGLGG